MGVPRPTRSLVLGRLRNRQIGEVARGAEIELIKESPRIGLGSLRTLCRITISLGDN